ncbi:hypothetical protein B0H14DRAFT_3462428 [Mycena olivaceomarginata]|nr:hypothetical protein B0H14DRAFT_3462428 [Mycena olivaceomarginata]
MIDEEALNKSLLFFLLCHLPAQFPWVEEQLVPASRRIRSWAAVEARGKDEAMSHLSPNNSRILHTTLNVTPTASNFGNVALRQPRLCQHRHELVLVCADAPSTSPPTWSASVWGDIYFNADRKFMFMTPSVPGDSTETLFSVKPELGVNTPDLEYPRDVKEDVGAGLLHAVLSTVADPPKDALPTGITITVMQKTPPLDPPSPHFRLFSGPQDVEAVRYLLESSQADARFEKNLVLVSLVGLLVPLSLLSSFVYTKCPPFSLLSSILYTTRADHLPCTCAKTDCSSHYDHAGSAGGAAPR